MEKLPDYSPKSQREKALVFLRDLHDCETVADHLGLQGQGFTRLCPKCQAGHDATEKTLVLQSRFFECTRCGTRGDVIELVRGVRGCSIDDAVAFLTEVGLKRKNAARFREQAESQFQSLHAAQTDCKTEGERGNLARKAFLTQCQQLSDEDLCTLRACGVTAEAANHFQLRDGPADPTATLRRLIAAFGVPTLLAAGLIEEARQVSPEKQYHLVFEDYERERLPYIVVPYFKNGDPIFIRTIPMIPTGQSPRKNLPLALGTGAVPPCPFNAGAIGESGALFIFRREVEAMAATSSGYNAIATSFTTFPEEVVPSLAGREVYIVALSGHDIDHKLAAIDAAFIANRVPPPKRLFREEWEPVCEVLNKEVDLADTAMISYDFRSEKIAALSELEKATDLPVQPEVKVWSPLAFVSGLFPAFVTKHAHRTARKHRQSQD